MFESQTIPVLIAFVVLIAILVPNVLLWITYRKYKRVAKALPDPRELRLAGSESIDEKRAGLTARLLDDWETIPAKEVDVARNALWNAMLLEAASDSSIDPREMTFVADLFGRLAGKEMDFGPVIQAAENAQKDKKSAFAVISKAEVVSDTAKKQILAGAFLVSVSDHALLPQETDCLMRIADALAINRRDRTAIFEEITARFDA